VSDFLLPDGTWNVQRLHQFFIEEDIEEITKIKASRHNEDDFVAWFLEKNSVFIVRNAYRMMLHCEMLRQDHGAMSTRTDGANPSWKLIWSCPIPPKVSTRMENLP
jgi:hypothetical protein